MNLNQTRPAAVGTAMRRGLALCVCAVATASHADVNNGSFETGTLSGWTSSGVVAVIGSGGGGARDGSFQAYLDTSPSNEAVGPHSSSLTQTFTGQGSIGFWWNFATNEPAASSFNDTAFVILDGVTVQLADTHSALVSSTLGGYADMTGYRYTTLALGAGSTHTVTFGIRDGVDGAVDSALLVDAVGVVPEPSAAVLVAFGLAGLCIGARRRKKNPDPGHAAPGGGAVVA